MEKTLSLHQPSDGHLDLNIYLQQEFSVRCKRNPRYSLRGFAKLLELDPSTVSQLISGKRLASKKLVEKICFRLETHPLEKEQLINRIDQIKANKKISRDPNVQFKTSENYKQLTLDAFQVISDWCHYAILELTFIEGFQSSPAWIARTLGITAIETRAAIDRLKRLELIEEHNGKLRKTDALITNGLDGMTSSGLKQLQRQVLQKALDAIDSVPQDEKDISSMTMSIDPSKLHNARQLIKNFRRQLCQFLENGKRARVYHLGIQLYPVSKSTKNT